MNIGKSLKIALALKEVKQKDLAEYLDVHHQAVSRWCQSEDQGMHLHTLNQICDFLGMTPSELLSLGED